MGYYTRVLSRNPMCVPFAELEAHLISHAIPATLAIETGSAEDWQELILAHAGGDEIAIIERNPITVDSLGEEEISEFVEEVQTCQPASSAAWLIEYFKSVQVIYTFQHLHGSNHSGGEDILAAIKHCIWNNGDAILQADHEGFTNEDGYHILWQFSAKATGKWWMALLLDGQWRRFAINLDNQQHRQAFLMGQVPSGAALPA